MAPWSREDSQGKVSREGVKGMVWAVEGTSIWARWSVKGLSCPVFLDKALCSAELGGGLQN